MKSKYHAHISQGARLATLKEVVNALNNPSRVGASICFHRTESGYHGHYIHWRAEAPRLMDEYSDHARLLLRLEEFGLITSKKTLKTALWLVPRLPEGRNPLQYVEELGGAA